MLMDLMYRISKGSDSNYVGIVCVRYVLLQVSEFSRFKTDLVAAYGRETYFSELFHYVIFSIDFVFHSAIPTPKQQCVWFMELLLWLNTSSFWRENLIYQ